MLLTNEQKEQAARTLYYKSFNDCNPSERFSIVSKLRANKILPTAPTRPESAELSVEVQAAKDKYLQGRAELKQREAELMEAIEVKRNLKREIQDLKLKLQRGDIKAGTEKAEALKRLHTLNIELESK
jgi:hypothetical protein